MGSPPSEMTWTPPGHAGTPFSADKPKTSPQVQLLFLQLRGLVLLLFASRTGLQLRQSRTCCDVLLIWSCLGAHRNLSSSSSFYKITLSCSGIGNRSSTHIQCEQFGRCSSDCFFVFAELTHCGSPHKSTLLMYNKAEHFVHSLLGQFC